MREAIIAAITVRERVGNSSDLAVAAILLRSLLPDAHNLSTGERALLEELLDRLGAGAEASDARRRDAADR